MKCATALFLLNTLCDNISLLFFRASVIIFVTACTKIQNCSKSLTSKKSQKHNIYEIWTKTAVKNAHFWEAKTLLGSATIC